MKPYRKIYYSNQLRVFETDTKYKTIGVQLVTGDTNFDSGTVAILAQGQVDMNNLLDAFTDLTQIYSDGYFLTLKIFRWSYSVSFSLKISAPSLTFFVDQFLTEYGFDIDNFVYSYRFIDLVDMWYLILYYSNRYFFSVFHSAKAVLGSFKSRKNFKINFLLI